MTTLLLQEESVLGQPGRIERRAATKNVDTVRALCHDLRQPLSAILLLAGAESGDLRRRFDGILDQAQWLADMVEGVIGGAAGDLPERVDVVDLTLACVQRSKHTADCDIGFISTGRAMAVVSPVALSRALGCVVDNAVRAAGPGGHVTVHVWRTVQEVIMKVVDDGSGLGYVPIQNSLGLTITRALVSACGGEFELKPAATGGMVARIVLPALSSRPLAS